MKSKQSSSNFSFTIILTGFTRVIMNDDWLYGSRPVLMIQVSRPSLGPTGGKDFIINLKKINLS